LRFPEKLPGGRRFAGKARPPLRIHAALKFLQFSPITYEKLRIVVMLKSRPNLLWQLHKQKKRILQNSKKILCRITASLYLLESDGPTIFRRSGHPAPQTGR